MSSLLDDLDDEQRAAATAVSGPVCIIAGAGTGKTRTVTYRLAYGIASGDTDPKRALAITHSKKAAAELAGRLHSLGAVAVDSRTFHAAGLRVARQFWARIGRREPAPAVLSEGESWRLWRDSLRGVSGVEPVNATVRDLVDEVSWARSQLVGLNGYSAATILAGRDCELAEETVVACWTRYQQLKERLGRVDFADLLDIAASLLIEDEEVARLVRHRWTHVTVDEYQDTDPAQQRLLDAILGGSEELCVVGDPRQAIYSWKGANPGYLTGFTKRYPTARVFDLTLNYRSTPPILRWANNLAHERGVRPLKATRPAGPIPKVRMLESEMAEAAWVAGAARRAIASGTAPSEIAVLYRFNASQARFEAAFARFDIPTVVAEDTPFFEREEIRAVLIPFGQAARRQPETNGLQLLSELLDRTGFDRDSPPAGLGSARSRWESQVALVEVLEGLPEASGRDASWLLSQVNELARRTRDQGSGGVTLATLHRAKGLEWDVVFVVGVTDGAIPSAFATTHAEQAEEERLLHVGVTRARHELHLTWPAANPRGWANRPSPFLDLLRLAPRPDRKTSGGRTRREDLRPGRIATKGSPHQAHCAVCLCGCAQRSFTPPAGNLRGLCRDRSR